MMAKESNHLFGALRVYQVCQIKLIELFGFALFERVGDAKRWFGFLARIGDE